MSEDEKDQKKTSSKTSEVRKIFISHASVDATIANEIVQEMESRGLNCWIAPRDIRPGSDYSEEIIHGITNSDAMLVLISEKSLSSRHVRSEVSRAADLGHPIYPVRLVDIEIAGGLRFFLELSQWIDLFPKTTPDIYNQLATSIKEGRAVQQQQQNKKKQQSILLFGLLGILALFYVISSSFNTHPDDMYDFDPVAYEKEWQEIEKENEKTRQEQKINDLDIAPHIEDANTQIFLHSIANVYGLPEGATFSYSFDGKKYEDYPIGQLYQWKVEITDPYNKKLLFKLIDKNGKTLKEIDKTNLLQSTVAGLEKRLNERLEAMKKPDKNPFNGRGSYCEISKCTIKINDSLCNPLIKSLSLAQGDKEFDIDLSECSNQYPNKNYCITQQELPFSLHPDAPPVARFRLHNGETVDIPQSVDVEFNLSGIYITDWYVIEPEDGKPNDPKLYAAFSQDNRLRGFKFIVGAGRCPKGPNDQHDNRFIFTDLDGYGLLEAGSGTSVAFNYLVGDHYGQNKTSPINQDLDTIKVAMGPKSGPNEGPWTYKIDLEKIVEKSLPRGTPEIICSDDPGAHRNIQKTNPKECMAKESADFLSVAKIEFGATPGNYSEALELDFTPGTYLWTECSYQKKNCPPFRFEVPKSWENLYSRITLKDGTVYPEKRHRLDQVPQDTPQAPASTTNKQSLR